MLIVFIEDIALWCYHSHIFFCIHFLLRSTLSSVIKAFAFIYNFLLPCVVLGSTSWCVAEWCTIYCSFHVFHMLIFILVSASKSLTLSHWHLTHVEWVMYLLTLIISLYPFIAVASQDIRRRIVMQTKY